MGNTQTTTITTNNNHHHRTVEVIEVWTRPLNSLAAAFGGVHSFTILKLSDKSYRIVEKHHDGTVDCKVLTRRERIDLILKNGKTATGYKKVKRAGISQSKDYSTVKDNITLKDIQHICTEHYGLYDIHTANCHRLSSAIWNMTVKEKKQTDKVIQQSLSKLASMIGIGASVRQEALQNDNLNQENISTQPAQDKRVVGV